MKNKFIKAVLPVVLLGSPALSANSARSVSRWKAKKAVVQSSDSVATIPEVHSSFENPFGGFGGANTYQQSQSTKADNVLSFLAKEGLLQANNEVSTIVSGTARKEFLVPCVAGATYNGRLISRVSTFFSSSNGMSDSSVSINYATGTPSGVRSFGNASLRAAAVLACQTAPPPPATPEQIPTLSQWALYLLMSLLALIGLKPQWLSRFKSITGQKS